MSSRILVIDRTIGLSPQELASEGLKGRHLEGLVQVMRERGYDVDFMNTSSVGEGYDAIIAHPPEGMIPAFTEWHERNPRTPLVICSGWLGDGKWRSEPPYLQQWGRAYILGSGRPECIADELHELIENAGHSA